MSLGLLGGSRRRQFFILQKNLVDPVVLEVERLWDEPFGDGFHFAVVVGSAAIGSDDSLFKVCVVEVGAAVVTLRHRLLLLTPRF